MFIADGQCDFRVVPLEDVGLRLDTEDMRSKSAADGVRIQLEEEIGFWNVLDGLEDVFCRLWFWNDLICFGGYGF